jgi:hypothetical protein
MLYAVDTIHWVCVCLCVKSCWRSAYIERHEELMIHARCDSEHDPYGRCCHCSRCCCSHIVTIIAYETRAKRTLSQWVTRTTYSNGHVSRIPLCTRIDACIDTGMRARDPCPTPIGACKAGVTKRSIEQERDLAQSRTVHEATQRVCVCRRARPAARGFRSAVAAVAVADAGEA